MLVLNNIIKDYPTGTTFLRALKGVSVSFRDSEFVAVLGPSGCGKTTLLNIIGGLDHYTDGDLIINNRSTKEYSDRDWDTYRNHSIGFVFQSYNLIPHQTILANVELALTLSGVGKVERREKAIEVLKKVGLEDQINKKPNQLSGGQMQRVAIARALVNDPDILLADEPTGALDSKTSVQIMELLKEIAQDKLVIMVTHNPELADTYANRIIKLSDGELISDSNPFDGKIETNSEEEVNKKVKKNRSMSFFTALSLSFNNLMTKKGRTILTAFAGSIGIIGIALILSVSTGVNEYINTVEEQTMSSYPLTIEEKAADYEAMINTYQSIADMKASDDGYVEANGIMTEIIASFSNSVKENNLSAFKEYIESDKSKIKDNATSVEYSYQTSIHPYYYDSANGYYTPAAKSIGDLFSTGYNATVQKFAQQMSAFSVSTFNRLIGDDEFVQEQYELVDGAFPKSDDEILILVDEKNRIADFVLYSLGLLDTNVLFDYIEAYTKHMINPAFPEPEKPVLPKLEYQDIIGYEFKTLLDTEKYKIEGNTLKLRNSEEISEVLTSSTHKLKVVGIVKPSDKAQMTAVMGGVLYRYNFMNGLIIDNNKNDQMKLQMDNPEINVFYNHRFDTEYTSDDYEEIKNIVSNDDSLLAKALNSGFSIDNVDDMVLFANSVMLMDYESSLEKLGYVDFKKPSRIMIYPKDFKGKDVITSEIKAYNSTVSDDDQITFTDVVGILISSVTIIVNAISYVLIAFVSISLVVSSIMNGIMNYISVRERNKEIGILRAIGASKKDIARVFNAETISIGFIAGLMGIIISLLLIIPINQILHRLTKISYLSAQLPILGAVILIVISIFLTFIAGLIPSGLAARKDPVVALRSE